MAMAKYREAARVVLGGINDFRAIGCRFLYLPRESSPEPLWFKHPKDPSFISSGRRKRREASPSYGGTHSSSEREKANSGRWSGHLDVFSKRGLPWRKLSLSEGGRPRAEKPIKRTKRVPPGLRKFEDLTSPTATRSELPFDFRYSYTEVPKVAPIKIQEIFSPFGPGRLDRKWDGQAALHNLPEKKVGSMKTYRDDTIGEPLTPDEVQEFVDHCLRSEKQINIGRDGLTHNMLIVIHEHWKREKVVKIKCMGVPTVDMENVYFHIEDKTGGKIIYRAGSKVYLFRGRNYDPKRQPNIPPMLWRPHSPIYPSLVQKVPKGLTLEEANKMRKRGLKIMPLIKLKRNKYYGDLVKHVREAFRDDQLVRIDCKGLAVSDYKKIGAKLTYLVPCILLSFEREQIILWRGKNWTSKQDGENTRDGDSSDLTNPLPLGLQRGISAIAAEK